MITIYIWILLSRPMDRMICSMWISQPPTQAVMESAGCVWTPEQGTEYVWRALDLYTRQVICERPASELPGLTCDLWPLDHYLLRAYEPNYQEQICTISTQHSGPPTTPEILEECGAVNVAYELKMVASNQVTPQPPPEPFCQLPPLQLSGDPTSLATHQEYLLLQDKLRWYYGNGTLADDWQNQWDPQIYAASTITQVPPELLKGMIAQESQFWPLWSGMEEVGLGQLTDDGADLALRMSHDLYAETCTKATITCTVGYDVQRPETKQLMRDILRRSLRVYGTPRQAAASAEGTILTWARILAAYYCTAGDIVRSSGQAPGWSYALAAYHAGTSCIQDGVICPEGQKYLVKVMK